MDESGRLATRGHPDRSSTMNAGSVRGSSLARLVRAAGDCYQRFPWITRTSAMPVNGARREAARRA